MTIAQVLFSSESGEHTTPKDLFDRCNERWGPFTLDAAATPENALCAEAFVAHAPAEMPEGRFFHENAVWNYSRWAGRVWCNPPYGESEQPCKKVCIKKRCVKRGWHATEYIPGTADFVEKAFDMVKLGSAERVVMLLPVRTDTRWWQEYVKNASERHYLKGRLKFSGAKNSAPFPSAIVVFERPFE